MPRMITILLFAAIFVLLDWYAFQAIKAVMDDFSPAVRRPVYIIYWIVSFIALGGFIFYNAGGKDALSEGWRTFLFGWIFVNYASKFFGSFVLIIDDIIRMGQWTYQQFSPAVVDKGNEEGISRSEFLATASVVATVVPAIGFSYGIASVAHDYRIHRLQVPIPNLPKSLEGIRIAQLSDIHSGSFFNRTAVMHGVEMVLAEKPDLIFFTGDLVNNRASEMEDYLPVFKNIKAPLGVYSVLGNHDYGDYASWPSQQAKQKNLQMVKEAHAMMNWNLLLDKNEILKIDNSNLAIIGVENWGTGGFAQYGHLDRAYQGAQDADTRILLSHDPSHWDAQVRPDHPDIELTLSGHTHGGQVGIEWGSLRWSFVQYRYKQWAGMYQEGHQKLYVNRGYGYIGYPGRLGIRPEITLLELVQA
uniref:Metallophosphoesterase n=1 Tax=Roseihalotalea indica TaxID=2867963 RepID=A0AA49JKK1_9BACT|nr:metallophosphoesterase [Tunicatimonas sp. TK19036]WKN40394.1 metallophosphoesterase [Tunicatimonas sp. TK19036]